jgi:hypothetical protein
MRIAVLIQDKQYSGTVINLLRNAGHLVVEPEIAELLVTDGPHGSLRLSSGSGHGQMTWVMRAPAEPRDVLAFILRRAPTARSAGSHSPTG